MNIADTLATLGEAIADVTNGVVNFANRPKFNGAIPWDNANLPFPSNRNKAVDPMFEMWYQTAAAAVSTTTTYGNCVHHLYRCGAGGVATNGLEQFAGDEPAGVAQPAYFFSEYIQTTASTGTVAADTAPMYSTIHESVRSFQGRSVTFSIFLKCASGTVSITSARIKQVFGTSGSASVVTAVPVNWTVTTAWQRFSVRLDVPSIVGKTVATDATDNVQLGFYMPPGALFTLHKVGVQTEECLSTAPATGAPTPFEYLGRKEELDRRNYWFQPSKRSRYITYMTAGGEASAPIDFPPMRIGPVVGITAYNQNANSSQLAINIGSNSTGWIFCVATNAGQAGADISYYLDSRYLLANL